MTSTFSPKLALLLFLLPLALTLGCDDDGGSSPDEDTATDTATGDILDDTADDTSTADSSGDDTALDATDTADVVEAPTEVMFDLDSELAGKNGFYDLPWPSDARLTPDGHPDVAALTPSVAPEIYAGLLGAAAQLRGFPTMPVAWFRFTAAMPEHEETTVIAADAASPVLLVDVDPDSPERGRLYPVVARSLSVDSYVASNTVGLAPRQGFVLAPERTFAFVVKTDFLDADGEPLAVSEAFAALAAGTTPSGARADAVASSLEPLWPVLDDLGIAAGDVAAATVFTTGDAVADLYDISENVLSRYTLDIEDLALEATWDRYCHLTGTLTVPEFQDGEPPYSSTGGMFVFDAGGELVEQRQTTIPVTITIPRTEMPVGGFPLVQYYHGSGGISTQCVDRGPRLTPDGPETPGEGPAYVVAEHGIAMACSAHPVNPERVDGAADTEYLQLGNPRSLRDIFRQGVIEQRLYLDALLRLEIDPAVLDTCTGTTLPAGETAIRFRDDEAVAMGQSMGGMYANLVASVEPRFTAAIPTGAGGFWSYFITVTTLLDAVPALELLLDARDLNFAHPVLHVVQMAYEPSDPVAAMPRLARRPLPDHPVRHIYEPLGKDDRYFPVELFDAVVLAYGHPQAGEVVWQSMQDALALDGLDGLVDYPVSLNLEAETDGTAYTGIAVQYEGDGIDDPHAIYVQREEVRYQYGCFLQTLFATGTPVVPAPATLGTPCE